MKLDISSLPDDSAELKEIIVSLAASRADLEEKQHSYQSRIDYLQERIRLLQNELFGRKSEKLTKEDRRQLLLFNEVETTETTVAIPNEITIAAHTRRKTGRKPLPKELPRVEVIHDRRRDL
jgi:transposase